MTALVGLGAVSMLAWTCGDPPVRLGGNDLIFGTDSNAGFGGGRVARLSLGSSAPFDHWDYRGDALIANAASNGSAQNEPIDPFALPEYPIDGTGPVGNLFVEYDSEHAFWIREQARRGSADLANQHEIVLFARDPQEQAETMRSFTGSYPDIDKAIQAFKDDWSYLWDVRDIPIPSGFVDPPSANFNGGDLNNLLTSPEIFPLLNRNVFWPNYVPGGPGTDPGGHSSVKAVKIINRGLCGKDLAYYSSDPKTPGILQTVVQDAPAAIAGGIVESDCHANVTIPWSQGGSFLDFTTEREDRQLGGFFFNMAETSSGYLNVQSKVIARAAVRFRLFDGRLSTEGVLVGSQSGGGVFDVLGLVDDKVVNAISQVFTSDKCATATPQDLGVCSLRGGHMELDACPDCADGYLCTSIIPITDVVGADCSDEEYGVLFAKNGKSDWVRYSDRAAYTGEPIPPPPTTCPDVPGLHLCGGACGACPSGWFCIGRSPMHPISLCFPPGANAQHPYDCSKPGACDVIGTRCFTFKVDGASQAIADANGLCVTDAQCPLAAQYPGGASCQ